jgi:predicted protein tyrosine phosphatase
MISQLRITNLSEAEKISYNQNNLDQNVWISVVGQEDRRQIARIRKNFQTKNVKFFHQFFADWSDEDGIAWGHLKQDSPERYHVQNIITFLKPFTASEQPFKLGVNCFAGISRSTAVGLIALIMSGRTSEHALAELLKTRPEAWPNLRILGFASEILGSDIKDYVQAWKQNCQAGTEIFLMPDRKQEHST